MSKNKYVLFHPGSDQYMYAYSEDERDILMQDGTLVDVTGGADHCDRATLQLGEWTPDANEQADTAAVIAGGSIETTEGTLIISADSGMVEIPQAIYQQHQEELDQLAAEPKISAEPEQDWFFTFCGNHEHCNGYVKIHGTYTEARKKMWGRFGEKWAFQYNAEHFAGQAEEFGLYEVKL